jgi:hypothetical protein
VRKANVPDPFGEYVVWVRKSKLTIEADICFVDAVRESALFAARAGTLEYVEEFIRMGGELTNSYHISTDGFTRSDPCFCFFLYHGSLGVAHSRNVRYPNPTWLAKLPTPKDLKHQRTPR